MHQIENWPFYLYEDFLTLAFQDWSYRKLRLTLDWKEEEITLFGKTMKQPRLISFYGSSPYTYSGKTHYPETWTPELLAIRSKIAESFNDHPNTALVNYYRDGKDSMGWHSDNEPELGNEPTIYSISFGVARDFKIRRKSDQKTITLALPPGSLLLMRGASQSDYQHCIPKRKALKEGRINITFRTIIEPD